MSNNSFSSPEDVEAAFYKAIEKRNLTALMTVWAEDEEIVCIHPSGAHLVGFAAIQSSWRSILNDPRVEIRHQAIAQWQGMMMVVRHLIEQLHAGRDASGPIQATHVYLRGPHGWRLVCRHASPGSSPILRPEKEYRVLH
ncbi:MAG: nuclear transport factor 2 family protein [Zoogloeaceae bacterium]|jgi:ketosteroid isomerase-like protein|nr:nuclear transport factor 2 family protein [Zoogloeaceae bacterium]